MGISSVGRWRCLFALGLLFLCMTLHVKAANFDEAEDNEFAEFDHQDAEVTPPKKESPPPPPQKSQPKSPETPKPPVQQQQQEQQQKSQPAKPVFDDDDDEFEDDDEELYESNKEKEDDVQETAQSQNKAEKDGASPQPLKFADVPAHFRSNWVAYQAEAAILVVLVLYLLNYLVGRGQNHAVATQWQSACEPLLRQQFAVVGDDGVSERPQEGTLIRDTDCQFTLWCSGRVALSSLLVQIRTQKRQDLVRRVLGLFSQQHDRVVLRAELDVNEIDALVVAFGQRKPVQRQFKELLDLSMLTTERRIEAFGSGLTCYGDTGEATAALIDPTVVRVVNKHADLVEYVHISDWFCGARPPEGEPLTRQPELIRTVTAAFRIPSSSDTAEKSVELLNLFFHIVERTTRVRLSKEAKTKAQRRRQQMQETFQKSAHLARQEAAQARREEKTRERKQRIMEEEDPDKQRRLEKLEQKRDAKAKQPRMKQIKLKM